MSLSTTHIFFMFVDEEKKSLVIWLGFQEILGLTLSQHSKRSEEASLYMHVSCSGQQKCSFWVMNCLMWVYLLINHLFFIP